MVEASDDAGGLEAIAGMKDLVHSGMHMGRDIIVRSIKRAIREASDVRHRKRGSGTRAAGKAQGAQLIGGLLLQFQPP